MIDIKSLKLESIMPQSILSDPQMEAIAKAIDPELQGVSLDTREALIISRIDELPEAVLDLMAWQWHVDFYEMELPIETKRELVQKSISMHRKKGTKWAVEQVVSIVFHDGKVIEWYEPAALAYSDGKPYTFGIETTAMVNDDMVLKKLIAAIFTTKNTRSWLEYIVMITECRGTMYVGASHLNSSEITIKPAERNPLVAPLFVGARFSNIGEITIKPYEATSDVRVTGVLVSPTSWTWTI